MRAVAKEGTYSIKPTKGKKQDWMGLNKAMNRQLDIIEKRATEATKKVKAAGGNRTEQRMAYTNTYSNWYKANAHKYGFTYTTKARKNK